MAPRAFVVGSGDEVAFQPTAGFVTAQMALFFEALLMTEESMTTPAVDEPSTALASGYVPTPSEKNWSVAAHLASVAGWAGIPFGHILAPLVVWLLKREDSEFIRGQAIESLNFQISMTIYAFLAGIIALTIIGLVVAIPAIIAIAIGDIIFTFIGALRVSEGVAYRYPWTIRLVS